MKRAVIYSRKQKSDYRGGYEYGTQMEVGWCKSKAGELNAEVVAQFEDVANTDDSERPEFEAALRYCEMHQVEFLIIYWLSTVKYPQLDLVDLRGYLAKFGTELVPCQRDIYSDPLEEPTFDWKASSRRKKRR